jgi:hypothetical protein
MSPAVLERLDDIETLLKGLPVPEFVGVQFVAAKLGVSTQYLRRRPYLLPAHGVTDVPGKLSWSFATVRAWLVTPPAERERQWFALSAQARAAITKRRESK